MIFSFSVSLREKNIIIEINKKAITKARIPGRNRLSLNPRTDVDVISAIYKNKNFLDRFTGLGLIIIIMMEKINMPTKNQPI